MKLPSIRSLFIPDPGYVILDVDLVKADLHVVVWEANDAELKQQLREGVDVYTEAGKIVGLTSYPLCKRFIHLSNYAGSARTAAIACSLTVHEAETAQKQWYGAHPGIPGWHKRTRGQLPRIRNAFGYIRTYFGLVDDKMLKEALAWTPQSTVARVVNGALADMHEQLPLVEPLIHGHDSLVMQVPQAAIEFGRLHAGIKRIFAEQIVPYDDPLCIPAECKMSDQSWGACEKVAW